jgi:hypothetical protein
VVTEAQVEGTTIPEAVAVEGDEGPISPEDTEEVHDDTLPDSSIVIRSAEIQDVEPIRSVPMSETVTTSRGGLGLLADDLINLAMVARNLE